MNEISTTLKGCPAKSSISLHNLMHFRDILLRSTRPLIKLISCILILHQYLSDPTCVFVRVRVCAHLFFLAPNSRKSLNTYKVRHMFPPPCPFSPHLSGKPPPTIQNPIN